ncbi:CheW protein [Natrialba hulunbeirensis JCM 10989]|uniref:CheW protein n=1 Tax=Natrialba hulunbeirensis JCM 10989 TaxID=1227493 RepID=L9ZNH3_9EURY|nr:chemotaxis protein CheW [Natrialba hulunbeirensis]ELY87616.1 CheW protein [Natrialba hulunbeirensis JCM 10989]
MTSAVDEDNEADATRDADEDENGHGHGNGRKTTPSNNEHNTTHETAHHEHATTERSGIDIDVDPTSSLRVLTFDLGTSQYCVRADAVATVLPIADASGLDSSTDPWNAGIVTADGTRIRVVDLHSIFEGTTRDPASLDDPLLLVFAETDTDEAHYGWLVDDVDVTRTIRLEDIAATQTTTQFVVGRLELDGERGVDGDDTDIVVLDDTALHR